MTWEELTVDIGKYGTIKEAFLIRYALNRAAIMDGSMSGLDAANEAAKAWDTIQNILKGDKNAST